VTLLSGITRFGEFELAEPAGELRRQGTRVPLQEKPLRILAALLDAPGELITREQLRSELWPAGTFVDFEHGLNAAMGRLRAALGDTAETPRFIQTIPRRGYRFVAPVEVVHAAASARRAVAVLPFRNLAGDAAGDWLCDGLTEDLITTLSCIDALRVVSRTSAMQFRAHQGSLRDIASALRVEILVDGSVRRFGDRVRIAARLVDAWRDEQLWAQAWERDLPDVFRLQLDVALAVAAALAPELTSAQRARIARPGTVDAEAYRLYLQGRHCVFQFTERGIRRGIEHFARAADCDARYARPHFGTGFAYMVLAMGHGAGDLPAGEGYKQSRQAIDRALTLDPLLGEAHAVDACLKFMFDYDWPGAEEAFARALACGPASAETYDAYGLMLSALRRYDEALVAQRRAHELDPLAPVVMSDIATTLLRAGRDGEALAQAEALLALEPAFPMAHSTRGWACIRLGRHAEGLRSLAEAVRLTPDNTMFLAQQGQALATTGAAEAARDVLTRLEARAARRYVSPYHLAYVHTGLGDAGHAIDCLERAADEQASGLYGVHGSFLFTSLQAHPRFRALLRRLRLA
jgi:TolB-like protein/Tfp pilus assembly protein PilF